MTVCARGQAGERTVDAQRVAEFKSFVGREVLLHDEVLGYVPVMDVAGEDELGLQFMGRSSAEFGIGLVEAGGISHHFLLDTRGLVETFIFDVKNWINAVLARQRPEPIFQSPTGKNGAVTRRRLSFQVKF